MTRGAPHNFGECRECGCLTTRLMRVTNLSTGEMEYRVCCRIHPSRHWRRATMRDIALDEAPRSGR